MEKVKIHLQPQHKKMLKGHPVQLSKECVGGAVGDSVEVMLSKAMLKKIQAARRLKKGVRLQMSPQEIEGSGLKEFFQGAKKVAKGGVKIAKKAGKFYKDNLKEDVGPIIKGLVEQGLDVGLTAAEVGAPSMALPIEIARKKKGKIVDWIGKTSGAYGVCTGMCAECGCTGTFYPIQIQWAPQPYDGYGEMGSFIPKSMSGRGFRAV